MTSPTVLRTVLGSYPHTAALKRGELSHPSLRLDFMDVEPVHKAFAPMVRNASYDLCELAVVTGLQAIAYDRPVVMLPAVVASRFQRGCLIRHRDHPFAPTDLAGKRIAVRAYTQTTGMWVREHLTEDYGLPSQDVRWMTRDDAHVEEYNDPAFVEHISGNKSLPDMLRDGDIEAAILGNDLPKGDEFLPVIPDAAARDYAWWQQHGFMPINHMVVVGRDIAEREPEAVRAAYQLLVEADRLAYLKNDKPHDEPRPTAFGFSRLCEPVQYVIDACMRQGLLPHHLHAEEVFESARKILGALAD